MFNLFTVLSLVIITRQGVPWDLPRGVKIPPSKLIFCEIYNSISSFDLRKSTNAKNSVMQLDWNSLKFDNFREAITSELMV